MEKIVARLNKVLAAAYHWVLVQIGVEKEEFTDWLFPEEVFRALHDEEIWKTIPKDSKYVKYVSEDEFPAEYQNLEEYPSVSKAEDRLRGCPVRDRVMPVGTIWTDRTTCTLYECKEFNMLTEMRCPEGCFECHFRRCKEIPGDPNADYPDCCPTVQCEPPKFRNVTEFLEIADQCKMPQDCC